jgi:hypothetical protein
MFCKLFKRQQLIALPGEASEQKAKYKAFEKQQAVTVSWID